MPIRTALLLLLLAAPGTLLAQQPDGGRSILEISALGFMAGHWVSPDNNDAEEVWLAPRAGSMAGSFRVAIPEGHHVLEYLVIQQTETGVVLRFKHYRPDYSTWEQQANVYELTEAENNRAVFVLTSENKNVPQRMIYTSPAADQLNFVGESAGKEPLILNFFRRE